jgi:hypothetical protein
MVACDSAAHVEPLATKAKICLLLGSIILKATFVSLAGIAWDYQV